MQHMIRFGSDVLIKIAYIFWLFFGACFALITMQHIQCRFYYWCNNAVQPIFILPTRQVDQYHTIRHFTSVRRHHCCPMCQVNFRGMSSLLQMFWLFFKCPILYSWNICCNGTLLYLVLMLLSFIKWFPYVSSLLQARYEPFAWYTKFVCDVLCSLKLLLYLNPKRCLRK